MTDQPPNLPDLPIETLLQILSCKPTVKTTTKTKKTKKKSNKSRRTTTSSAKSSTRPSSSSMHALTLVNRQLHSKLNPFLYHYAVRKSSSPRCLPLIAPVANPKRGLIRSLQFALLEGADVNQLCSFREFPCCTCRVEGFANTSASGSVSAEPTAVEEARIAAATAVEEETSEAAAAVPYARLPRPSILPARVTGKTPAPIVGGSSASGSGSALASSSASSSSSPVAGKACSPTPPPPPPPPRARRRRPPPAPTPTQIQGKDKCRFPALITHTSSSSSSAPRNPPKKKRPSPFPFPSPRSSPSSSGESSPSGTFHPKACCYISLQQRLYNDRIHKLEKKERVGRSFGLTAFQAALLAGEEGAVLELMGAGADVYREFEGGFRDEEGGNRQGNNGDESTGEERTETFPSFEAFWGLEEPSKPSPPTPASPLEVLRVCSSCPVETAQSIAGWYGMVEVLRRLEGIKREKEEEKRKREEGMEPAARWRSLFGDTGDGKSTSTQRLHPFGFAAAAYLHFGSEKAMETVRFFALETELKLESWEQMMFDALCRIRKTKSGRLQFEREKVGCEAWLWDPVHKKRLMRVELRLKGSERGLGSDLVRARWAELKEMFKNLREEKKGGAEMACSKE